MGLVTAAKRTIRMTMQAREEIENPLPAGYFSLLLKKMKGHVNVTRIGFGSAEEFKQIKNKILIYHRNYRFHRTRLGDYCRMLLIDDSKLMFVVTEKAKKHVYYTEDKATIERYKAYFRHHYRQ